MTFPIELVGEFLGRTLVWLAVESVLAAAGLGAALLALRAAGRPLRPVPAAWAALAGALAGASLAHRFGLPPALELTVWRRSVPVAWSAGGALLAVLVWASAERLRNSRAAGRATVRSHRSSASASSSPRGKTNGQSK